MVHNLGTQQYPYGPAAAAHTSLRYVLNGKNENNSKEERKEKKSASNDAEVQAIRSDRLPFQFIQKFPKHIRLDTLVGPPLVRVWNENAVRQGGRKRSEENKDVDKAYSGVPLQAANDRSGKNNRRDKPKSPELKQRSEVAEFIIHRRNRTWYRERLPHTVSSRPELGEPVGREPVRAPFDGAYPGTGLYSEAGTYSAVGSYSEAGRILSCESVELIWVDAEVAAVRTSGKANVKVKWWSLSELRPEGGWHQCDSGDTRPHFKLQFWWLDKSERLPGEGGTE
ncbi:hypothetical protein BJ912DRAFT_931264 [Pholiota molesta]|nr:hypothetical protein BJ912DRAFT_931264 [Pholiota molesta]